MSVTGIINNGVVVLPEGISFPDGTEVEVTALSDFLNAFDEEEGDVQAVQAAVAEWQAGDEGLPLKEAFNEIRSGR
jgi:hypothetical protein